MTELKIYTGPKHFLEETGALLEEQEMENNVILGNCYNQVKAGNPPVNSYFINAMAGKKIVASCINLSPKVMITGTNPDAVRLISDFYKNNHIPVKGVIGDSFPAQTFAGLYPRKTFQSRTTFVQALEKVNDLVLPEGTLESSSQSDLSLLLNWIILFFEEEKLRPKKTADELKLFIQSLMEKGDLFSYVHKGEPVAMAGIIRKTRNTAIIGLVYTPPSFRGKGYAKSCVHQLSQYILNQGFLQSGLLVYENNLPARHIYKQIGYQPVSELLDTDFE